MGTAVSTQLSAIIFLMVSLFVSSAESHLTQGNNAPFPKPMTDQGKVRQAWLFQPCAGQFSWVISAQELSLGLVKAISLPLRSTPSSAQSSFLPHTSTDSDPKSSTK